MTRLLLFLHVLGFSFWIGGAFAMMMVSVVARREERNVLRTIARIQAAIARSVVGPGMGVAVVTGLILTFQVYGPDVPAPSVWLMVMQGAGLLGAIVSGAIALPAVSRLARLDPMGETAAHFDGLRRRARVAGMISSMLALVALLGGSMIG